MKHIDQTEDMQIRPVGNVVIIAMTLTALAGACYPDTETIVCENSSLRCPPGFLCSADQNTCIPNTCGDGIVSTGELCDDGNAIDGDDCDSNCTFTGCGNGIQTAGELCDDGNSDDNDDCVDDCIPAVCGDNHVRSETENEPENCDDGNTITEACPYGTPCMVCDETCHKVSGAVPTCGDGEVQPPEVCDDGNLTCGSCSQDCSKSNSAQSKGQIAVVDPSKLPSPAEKRIVFVLYDGYHQAIPFGLNSVDVSILDPSGVSLNTFSYSTTGSSNTTNVRNAVRDAIAYAHDNYSLLINPTIDSRPGSIVDLTNERFTINGDNQILYSPLPDGFTIVGMRGGAGGDCASGALCVSDADCLSYKCNGGKPGACE